MACYRTFPRSEEGGLSGGKGDEGGSSLADGSRRRSPLRYTAAYVPPPSPPLSLFVFSPSFSASDVLEPRLRTYDNETMAGLTVRIYIYIYALITRTSYTACIEMSVNNRHPPFEFEMGSVGEGEGKAVGETRAEWLKSLPEDNGGES